MDWVGAGEEVEGQTLPMPRPPATPPTPPLSGEKRDA